MIWRSSVIRFKVQIHKLPFELTSFKCKMQIKFFCKLSNRCLHNISVFDFALSCTENFKRILTVNLHFVKRIRLLKDIDITDSRNESYALVHLAVFSLFGVQFMNNCGSVYECTERINTKVWTYSETLEACLP